MKRTLRIIIPMLILIVAVLACGINSIPAYAHSDIKMCVYGEATTQVKTNNITVFLSIQNCSENLEDAQNLTLSQYENTVNNLSDYKFNVDYFYSNFSQHWRNNPQHCSAVNFFVSFETFDQAKLFIETATSQENVKVNTICFNATSTTDAYNNALTQAIENAKQKVSSILDDSNLEIKKVCEQPTYFGGVCKDFVSINELENVETIDVTAKVRVFFE